MTVLLENDRRARRVKLIVAASAVFCAGFLYWAVSSNEVMLAVLLALLGLMPLLGIIYYAQNYLGRIELRASRLVLTTASPIGSKVHDLDGRVVSVVRFHDWAIEPGSPVSTPFLTLRIAGRRSPFLIDLAADQVDREAIEALARRRPA